MLFRVICLLLIESSAFIAKAEEFEKYLNEAITQES